jgi:two-component system, sensor histidine kinase PdtaS
MQGPHRIGFTMMEKFPGIENTPLFRVLELCMRDGVSQNVENEFTYPDGSQGWFELRIQAVPEGLFILSMDISNKKRILKVLEERVEIRTREIANQKGIIEEKNKSILDSIHYTKKIQQSLLPTELYIERTLTRLMRQAKEEVLELA